MDGCLLGTMLPDWRQIACLAFKYLLQILTVCFSIEIGRPRLWAIRQLRVSQSNATTLWMKGPQGRSEFEEEAPHTDEYAERRTDDGFELMTNLS
jgi:hypothetical protein